MSKFTISAFADEAASDLNGQITALCENNIKNIEIRNIDGKSIIEHKEKELKIIFDKLSSSGISVSAIGSPIGKIKITDDFIPHKDAFKRTLQCADILKCDKIRMFSFFIPQNENSLIYRDEIFTRIDWLLDEARKHNVLCCHENEKDIYGDTKARCLDLYNSFSGRMGAIFDPANYIQCGENPGLIFDEIKPFITYIHIKDALAEDGSVVPAGRGDGDIKNILNKIDVDMILSIEPHLAVFEGLSNLQTDGLRHKFTYGSKREAFDAAVTALKNILDNGGSCYG